jgi:hypothetical protein
MTLTVALLLVVVGTIVAALCAPMFWYGAR